MSRTAVSADKSESMWQFGNTIGVRCHGAAGPTYRAFREVAGRV